MRDRLPSLLLLLCAACGPGRLIPADESSGTSATSSSTESETGQNSDPSDSSSAETSTDEGDSGTLVVPEDTVADPCDLFAQDCPDGEKCVPYSVSGETWDSTKCVPIMGPMTDGEPCISGGIVEATDDCDASGYCFDGTCHSFCTGSFEMPECPEGQACAVSSSSSLVLCIPRCDPVAQDCAEAGEGCFWSGTEFSCIPVANPPGLSPGEPCEFANVCEIGSICLDAALMPNCNGTGCCGTFCDLGLGDAQCAAVPGTTCVPFWAEGQAPPNYEHVGVCIIEP